MKNPSTKILAVALAIVSLISLQPLAFSQGDLTPPGAPGPTMKTLDQIESRTPISAAPFTINQPGSYYLTGNVAVDSGDAITVAASAVTLDLNGFTISSTASPAAGIGVLISGAPRNVAIHNGHIRGSVTQNNGVFSGDGFSAGVSFASGEPIAVRVSNLSVTGCSGGGIIMGFKSTIVQSCAVHTVGGIGVYADIVSDTDALDCGGMGIYCRLASNSRGFSFAETGLLAELSAKNCAGSTSSNSAGLSGHSLENCEGGSNGGIGIFGNNVASCWGNSLTGPGIFSFTVSNSYGTSGTGDGINAFSVVANSYGRSNTNGRGIFAKVVTGSHGISSGGIGVSAEATALNCQGESTSGTGLQAGRAAENSYGISSSGFGLFVSDGTATNCHGRSTSGTGLRANIVNACRGETAGGSYGVLAVQIAIGSYGGNSSSTGGTGLGGPWMAIGSYGFSNAASGTGLSAFIGNSTYGHRFGGVSNAVTHKYNAP